MRALLLAAFAPLCAGLCTPLAAQTAERTAERMISRMDERCGDKENLPLQAGGALLARCQRMAVDARRLAVIAEDSARVDSEAKTGP